MESQEYIKVYGLYLSSSQFSWYPTLTSLINGSSFTSLQIQMSVTTTMVVATTTVLTLMEVMFAPALVATSLTVTDTHVKVGTGK